MPLYYFHVTNGLRAFRDYEGVELPDLKAALYHALADARDIMEQDRFGSKDWSSWTFEITNGEGRYALTVPFADVMRGPGTEAQTPTEVLQPAQPRSPRHRDLHAHRDVPGQPPVSPAPDRNARSVLRGG